MARQELFSVNLARRLEKLPTPALESAGYQYETKWGVYSPFVLPYYYYMNKVHSLQVTN